MYKKYIKRWLDILCAILALIIFLVAISDHSIPCEDKVGFTCIIPTGKTWKRRKDI